MKRLIAPLILVGILLVFIILGIATHAGEFTAIGIFGAIFVLPIFIVLVLKKQRLEVHSSTELSGYLVKGDVSASFTGDIPQTDGKLAIKNGRLQFISSQGQLVINLGSSE